MGRHCGNADEFLYVSYRLNVWSRTHPTMILLALVAALMLEQWRPLADRHQLYWLLERYAIVIERLFNESASRQSALAWLSAVLIPTLCVWAAYAAVASASSFLALLVNISVLYLTMGFRQRSHYFTDIQLALKDNDIAGARDALSAWRHSDCGNMDREMVARLAVEEALIAAHQRVFAVAFWFVLLPGPVGAILYRLAMFLSDRWNGTGGQDSAGSSGFAQAAYAALDWLPARFTAATFAVAGDFEDAVYCWRTQSAGWPDAALGIVLSAGAGALGVKLGMTIVDNGEVLERPELGLGDQADEGHLDATVGLVWRALFVWLILLLLIAVAGAVA